MYAELVALDVADYNTSTHRVRIASGKGRKPASLLLTAQFRAVLAAHLEVRGREPGPLFGPVTKKGELLRSSQVRRARDVEEGAEDPLARLTERGFTRILKACCAQAGVRHLRPHDLRRSMITHLLDRTGDLAAAQRRARHANPTTTTRYDRRQQKRDDDFAAALDRTLTAERELALADDRPVLNELRSMLAAPGDTVEGQ